MDAKQTWRSSAWKGGRHMGVRSRMVRRRFGRCGGCPAGGDRAKPQITYTVRMVEAQGVEWRESVFSRLKPVTHQGAATVWTVPRDAATQLLESFSKCPDAKILQAPKVTSSSGVPTIIQCRRNRPVVTQASWDGRDPAGENPPEHVRVGWHTTMVGRKLDQGILVQVVFEDTVIRAVHHVKVDRATAHQMRRPPSSARVKSAPIPRRPPD